MILRGRWKDDSIHIVFPKLVRTLMHSGTLERTIPILFFSSALGPECRKNQVEGLKDTFTSWS